MRRAAIIFSLRQAMFAVTATTRQVLDAMPSPPHVATLDIRKEAARRYFATAAAATPPRAGHFIPWPPRAQHAAVFQYSRDR